MCPVCWTTALASFSILFAGAAIVIVGSDRKSQALISLLFVIFALYRIGVLATCWWSFVVVMIALLIRIAWIMCRPEETGQLSRIWQQGLEIAGRRCKRRRIN